MHHVDFRFATAAEYLATLERNGILDVPCVSMTKAAANRFDAPITLLS